MDRDFIKEQKSIDYPFLDKPVNVYTFENGHNVIVAPKEGELVNISSWVKTGSINENDEISGISHFLEHLMFKGTTKRKAGEFDRILESKGAIVNAATWKDYTFYYVTLPKGENNEQFKEAFELHADMMVNSIVPEEEMGPVFDVNNPEVKEKRERYVVIEEIRMREDQPWSKVYNKLNHNMYVNHPYKRDVIGTAEIIAGVSRETIMDYYKKWYTPSNITTIVVGDLKDHEVIDLAYEHFKFEKAKELNPFNCKIDEESQNKYMEEYAKVNTGFLMMGYHGANASNIKDTILLDVVSLILGEGKSSRLNENLIEKSDENIFNYVGADQYQFRDDNNFFVQANFNPEHKDKALDLIKAEIQKLIDSEVSEKELKKAKKKLKARFAHGAETVSEIGETIGYYMTVTDGLDSFVEYLDVLESISIADLKTAASQYLGFEKAVVSVLLPEEGNN